MCFEEKVLDALKKHPSFPGARKIGVAVSGGADSVSLLVSLRSVLPEETEIVALTVNHNIREASVSAADADFVEKISSTLSVRCIRLDIPCGKITEIAKTRGCGTEDAARFMRYDFFERTVAAEGIDILCLGHNRNDQIETVLMRFFQGSLSLGGIPRHRAFIARPLMGISRSEIEAYLAARNIGFCMDATNLDEAYLRNSFRNRIIPFLDTCLSGWRKAILSLAERIADDSDFLEMTAKSAFDEIVVSSVPGAVALSLEGFLGLHVSLRRRVVFLCLKKMELKKRVTGAFIERICSVKDMPGRKISGFGVEVSFDGDAIVFSKPAVDMEKTDESGFSVLVADDGIFSNGSIFFTASSTSGGICIESCGKKIFVSGLRYPFLIRSLQSGDRIRCGKEGYRSVSKILDSMKCRDLKFDVPLVQSLGNDQEIVCVWGGVCSFSDRFAV